MVCICDHLPSGLIIIFTLSKSGRWWETQRGILRIDFFWCLSSVCWFYLFIGWLNLFCLHQWIKGEKREWQTILDGYGNWETMRSLADSKTG